MAESKQRVTSEKSLEIPQIITSSSGPLTEELQCSICLDVFIDPVTIPCGHSFCKTCLKECWDNSKGCCCPYCKETFSKRPDLKVNTALRQVVQHFKEKSGLRKFCEVLCDICDERKLKAVKSCLVCQSSYCDTHLEPHHRVQRLKKHKLIDAVVNLEDYICQEHEKPLELFCRDDQMCVCLFCAATDHKTHNTVPIVEESGEKKNKLVKTQADVQQMIQDRIKKIQDIKNSAELRKKNTEEQTAASVELFMALMRSIERCQAELLEVMEEKQKAAEKQDEELIKELEKEITELKRKDAELEQLSHTEDHLYLLQIHPSLCSPPQTQSWTDVSTDTHLGVYMLRKFLNPLQMTLEEKLSETVSTELKMIHQHKVDVTLDPDTAHPELILSDDGKQISNGDIKHDLPDNPERFDKLPCVLGKEGFSLGRFYFEVQVEGMTGWSLGVVRESISRKEEIENRPQDGLWAVGLLSIDGYTSGESVDFLGVLDNNPLFITLRVNPKKVGVFVDYEEGLVSFYDVESRYHIYSFTGQSFTEKLYPYFSPRFADNDEYKNSAPMIILPVNSAG